MAKEEEKIMYTEANHGDGIKETVDHSTIQKTISMTVPMSFDVSAFKALMSGTDLKDYRPDLKNYSIINLFDELIERTKGD